jgi:DNA polymerase-1
MTYPKDNRGVIKDLGRDMLPDHVVAPDTARYSKEPVFLDFETTGLEHGHARNPQNQIICAAWAVGNGPVAYWRGNEFEHADLQIALQRCEFLVAHNAKFELQWLGRMGYQTERLLIYDTMLGEYVLAGNRPWELNLGAVSRRYGGSGKEGIIDALMQGGVCPSKMPEHLLKARVIKDVEDTRRIFYQQSHRLYEEGLLAVQYTRCLFTPVIADIEMQKSYLSAPHVDLATNEARKEEAALSEEFSKMTGGINSRSTKQMAEYVYGKMGFLELEKRGEPDRNKASKAFPDGAPKVDSETLDKLVAKTEGQRAFVVLRKKLAKVQARLSKTLEFFDGVCRYHNETFSGQINQAVTRTHRTSASGVPMTMPDGAVRRVQFQNFPNELKGLVRASGPGRAIVEIDGMQLEFRGAAELGNDEQAMKDIRNDEDIHRFTASVINNVPEAEVTKDQRKKAKAHTFKPLYGPEEILRGLPN